MPSRVTKAAGSRYCQARLKAAKYNEKLLTRSGAVEYLPGVTEGALKKYELEINRPPNTVVALKSTDSDVTADFTLPASALSGFTGTDNNAAFVSAEYGGSYSWYTATAGTGKSATASGNATSSICPKGWRLPTGGSGGEFEVMAKKYGSDSNQTDWLAALQATPIPGFGLYGGVNPTGVVERGEVGIFWSSTAQSATSAYDLNMNTSNMRPSTYNSKYIGRSVRCIARN